MNLFVYLMTGFAFGFSGVESIMFHLHPNTQKCLREELKKDALIVGEFEVNDGSGTNRGVDYVVRDTKGDILSQNSDISKGKFSFSAEHQDIFEICFTSRGPSVQGVQEISLNIKIGVEARTYEAIGEAGKLKPMEIELKKLEDLTQSIVEDFALMREREIAMRDTNESTNNRVLYLSIFSMVCLLSLSVWQVLYLRKFFKSRKLIE